MAKHVHRLASGLEEGKKYDLMEIFDKVALGIIMEAAFETDIESKADEMIHESFSRVMETTKINWTTPVPFGNWIPIAAHRLRWHHQGRIKKVAQAIIEKAKSSTCNTLRDADAKTLLDQLVRTPEFTEQGIIDNSLMFLFAGHETSSKCLVWTCMLLATHPDIMD